MLLGLITYRLFVIIALYTKPIQAVVNKINKNKPIKKIDIITSYSVIFKELLDKLN